MRGYVYVIDLIVNKKSVSVLQDCGRYKGYVGTDGFLYSTLKDAKLFFGLPFWRHWRAKRYALKTQYDVI